MDKIEKYKNLNEEVKKMLRQAEQTDSLSLQEQICTTAAELCEALDDPNRVSALMRSGLVDTSRLSRVRSALKNPDKAMQNAAVRSDLMNMLMSLINIVTSNPSAYASVKKGASKSAEPVEEELIGGQKKLDVNKNGKVDGADLAALRAGKKAEESEEEEEIEEEWKSLKKTKVDLNDLRQQGYRVVVQHGEGDTLYKIKGKGKKKVEEELIGGQKKLDVNKNGEVDAADLAALRAGKKS